MNDKMSKLKVLIAGGGTGGHLFPAIAIAEQLENENIDVRYIGSKNGIESKYDFIDTNKIDLLDLTGIYRTWSLSNFYKNLILPYKIIRSYFVVRKIFVNYKPDFVIGTGGYSCAIPLYIAIKRKVLTAIQEQNVIPGAVSSILQKKVDIVFTSFKETKKYLNNKNIYMTGNPLRSKISLKDKKESRNQLGLELDKFTVLVIGGSQGATAINNHILKNYKKLTNNGIQLIWQTGKNANFYKKRVNHPNIQIYKFINQIDIAYSACDIVISRAGATAISEILFLGKPSILIPYPYAAENHQEVNADTLVKSMASIKVMQSDLKSGLLEDSILHLHESKKDINEYSKNAKGICINNSAFLIKEKIKDLIKNNVG